MWRRASALRNGVRADMSAQLAAVKRGYAYVVQNERGHFFSEGTYDDEANGVAAHNAVHARLTAISLARMDLVGHRGPKAVSPRGARDPAGARRGCAFGDPDRQLRSPAAVPRRSRRPVDRRARSSRAGRPRDKRSEYPPLRPPTSRRSGDDGSAGAQPSTTITGRRVFSGARSPAAAALRARCDAGAPGCRRRRHTVPPTAGEGPAGRA